MKYIVITLSVLFLFSCKSIQSGQSSGISDFNNSSDDVLIKKLLDTPFGTKDWIKQRNNIIGKENLILNDNQTLLDEKTLTSFEKINSATSIEYKELNYASDLSCLAAKSKTKNQTIL